MLELRDYTTEEIYAYLQTKDNEATKRKLERYKVDFSTSGRGKNCIYTIKAINDPFKLLCVFDIGLDPHTNFEDFKAFMYYFILDENFAWRPAEMMEEWMRKNGFVASSHTISKWLKKLEALCVISRESSSPVYYKVYKDAQGNQCHEIITKEEYSKAWKVYWDCKNNGHSSEYAYAIMYNKLGGVPRKHFIFEFSAFYGDILDKIAEIVMDELFKDTDELGQA
jgi:hypothetical protein